MVYASCFDTRGVRVVTNVKRAAVDARRAGQRTASVADGEVVWSWRADAGAKLAAMRFAHRADDGGNKLVHRGELEVSRKPLAQGGPV